MQEIMIEQFKQSLAASGFVGEIHSPVFGEGKQGAQLMLVGEAPGKEETIQNRPFVGKAGKILDTFLEGVQLKRAELYITNAVKYRPYKLNPRTGGKSNRTPGRKEIAFCNAFLLQELREIAPKLVVTLGNVPLFAVTGRAEISSMHGKLHDISGLLLFPLYHPASIIYNPSLLEVYNADMVKLKEIVPSL